MAERKNYLSGIKLVYRRSSNWTKVVVIAALVLSTVALLTLCMSTLDLRAKTQSLHYRAMVLEEANRDLEADIQALGSVQSMAEIAQSELDLVDPDTVLIQPES